MTQEMSPTPETDVEKYTKLSVNLHETTAHALKGVMLDEDITATEAVMKMVAVYGKLREWVADGQKLFVGEDPRDLREIEVDFGFDKSSDRSR